MHAARTLTAVGRRHTLEVFQKRLVEKMMTVGELVAGLIFSLANDESLTIGSRTSMSRS